MTGLISDTIQLSNDLGEKLNRNVQKGDYIKIDIPGPGITKGDGYGGKFVDELKETNTETLQSAGFRVRPSSNPLNDENEIVHFYSNEATITFIVTRINDIITVQIIDQNLNPNEEISSVMNRLRNIALGVSALELFSKVKWKILWSGLLKKKMNEFLFPVFPVLNIF